MKYLVIFVFSLTLFSYSAMAQDYKKHIVEKGETVNAVAKKYKITPYDIYRLNPDAKNGIKENTTLLIPNGPLGPVPTKEQTTKVANPVHVVQPKETLYSLAKKYNVDENDIKKANAELLKDGLKVGQEIIIPVKGSGVAVQAKIAEKQEAKKNAPSYFYHTVAQGETKYSIAKQFGMSLQLLEELNPEVKDTLPLGYKLKLAKDQVIAEETQNKPAVNVGAPVTYTVKAKETFYSIGKLTGVTEEKIKALNPQAKDGLKEGMELALPAGTQFAASAANLVQGDLQKTLKKSDAKELTLLLPFNLYRIESDTVKSKLLRTDRFLNMTLDFYAGALIAIDSAKTLGLPLKVKILDSKETSKSSDVAGLKSSIASSNAMIGPFFQNNVEAAAALLPGVAIISPLSKDTGKPSANLYQSVPSSERLRQAMLDYLDAKNGNVVAVVDAKKTSSQDFIKASYPSAKLLTAVTAESLKALLVKDKTNYVILETESLTTITNTTKILTDALVDYPIQLVVLEKNDKLDHEEIPLARLTKLKLLYPSVTDESQNAKSDLFVKIFREKNGYSPNEYATRGFDVTFDTILRLFQPEEFGEVMSSKASEQVENKFAYTEDKGGNYNTGVYILQYNEDLTTKIAE